MIYPEGHRLHCSLCSMRHALGLSIDIAEGLVHSEPLRPLTRDEKIDWALGNMNASSNHKTTRAVVEAAYDRLYPKGAS